MIAIRSDTTREDDADPESKRHLHQIREVVLVYELSVTPTGFQQWQHERGVCLSCLPEHAENRTRNSNRDHNVNQDPDVSFITGIPIQQCQEHCQCEDLKYKEPGLVWISADRAPRRSSC